ncbi:MAG: peptidoglycan DD-metalloendopeptidase family protein [Deltaproteobacteria bacterium]|nr:peptidoglycan DD-metalloendopeptidase family protein [Deltaproteobacteria bacterium]
MACRLAVPVFVILLGACGNSVQGVYHNVERGETLYRIGKTYGVDSQRIARVNRIRDPQSLQVGQRLYIPGAARVKKIPAVSPAAANASKTPLPLSSQKPKKVSPLVQSRTAKKTVTSPPVKTVAPRFNWPVQGTILRNFDPAGSKPSRGLEIAVPFGSPVRSAAPGKVIYSGNGIRGYGNLLIIEHESSYFTVYGFNKNNLVHTGAFVGKGEKIALAGRPPDGGTPRLHFQVRQGKDVLDPLLFLP